MNTYTFFRPVVQIFLERIDDPQKEPLTVIKCMSDMIIREEENRSHLFGGEIQSFFPLMGQLNFLKKQSGLSDRYVLCWFDDREEDFNLSWKRLNGVRFSEQPVLISGQKRKPAYNVSFTATAGHLS